MNENINLIEILRDVPRGTKLYSSVCGECQLNSIYNNIIRCVIEGSYDSIIFDSKGRYSDFKGECVLFPSKENRDWSTFKVLKKHKRFEPYQRVLVASELSNIWEPDIYRFYDVKRNVHSCIHYYTIRKDSQIISYEGNENKLGKQIK